MVAAQLVELPKGMWLSSLASRVPTFTIMSPHSVVCLSQVRARYLPSIPRSCTTRTMSPREVQPRMQQSGIPGLPRPTMRTQWSIPLPHLQGLGPDIAVILASTRQHVLGGSFRKAGAVALPRLSSASEPMVLASSNSNPSSVSANAAAAAAAVASAAAYAAVAAAAAAAVTDVAAFPFPSAAICVRA